MPKKKRIKKLNKTEKAFLVIIKERNLLIHECIQYLRVRMKVEPYKIIRSLIENEYIKEVGVHDQDMFGTMFILTERGERCMRKEVEIRVAE